MWLATPACSRRQKEAEEEVLPTLSEQLTLDKLWDTLSSCLLELADTPDHHAVLVLQVCGSVSQSVIHVLRFFLIISSWWCVEYDQGLKIWNCYFGKPVHVIGREEPESDF